MRRQDGFELPCGGALNLGRREGHAVALLEDLTGRRRLPIDADEVVAWLAVGNPLGKEFFDGRALGDVKVVGEASPVVVDLCGVRDYAELLGRFRQKRP